MTGNDASVELRLMVMAMVLGIVVVEVVVFGLWLVLGHPASWWASSGIGIVVGWAARRLVWRRFTGR